MKTFGTLLLSAAIAAAAATCTMVPSRAADSTPPRGASTHPAPTASAAPAELYQQLVDEYLTAEWSTLETDLTKNAKEIKTLPKDQLADITYIQKTLAECRPAWWNLTRQSKRTAVRAILWGKPVPVLYDPQLAPNSTQMRTVNGSMSVTVSWAAAEMDSHDRAEHGFTKGDLADLGIWMTLESANVWEGLNIEKMTHMSPAEKTQLNKYQQFRGNLAGAYFGTPRPRRWGIFLSLDSYFGNHTTQEGFLLRRPLAAMVIAELASHADRYPSLHLTARGEITEASLATSLMNQFERTTLTLPEDQALRNAIRDFAAANTASVFDTGQIALPNHQTITLDSINDSDFAAKRDAWLKTELAKPTSP